MPLDKTPEGWSDVAGAYDDVLTPRFAPFAELALRETGLQQGERVLDVAAGGGALALAAARRGARVVATDFAPGMVERLAARARDEKLDVEALVMDAHALRIPDASFDAAYSAFGVMFFNDRVKALHEMRRVLRPDGRAAILTWSTPERSGFFRLFGEAMARALPESAPAAEPPTPFTMGEPDIVAETLRSASFERVQARRLVRTMRVGTPESAWNDFARTNPVVPELLAHIGEEHAPALQKALEEVYREHAVDGVVHVEAEAILGIGHA